VNPERVERAERPSLVTRGVAVLVLAVAGWILLKFVIGAVVWLATVAAVIVAVIAVIWALTKL
jgi:membrane protein YdbS with pleckstrin-like domain